MFVDSCAVELPARQCSWCAATADQHREASRATGRDAYRCSGCRGRTVVCTAFGCRRMAKGGAWGDTTFCAWCRSPLASAVMLLHSCS